VEVYAAGLAAAVAGVAAACDVTSRRIPNALTVPAALAGVAVHVVFAGAAGLGWSLAGLFGMGVPLVLAYLFIPIAPEAGDIKLLIALGAIAGWPYCWDLLLAALLWGGVVSLLALAFAGRMWRTLARIARMAFAFVIPNLQPEPALEEGAPALHVPYAVPICCAALTLLAGALGWAPIPSVAG